MIRAGTWATPPRLYAVWLALGFLFSPTGTLGPQLEKRGDNCWKDCWESVGGCWLIVADQVGLWKRELGLRVLGVLFYFYFLFFLNKIPSFLLPYLVKSQFIVSPSLQSRINTCPCLSISLASPLKLLPIGRQYFSSEYYFTKSMLQRLTILQYFKSLTNNNFDQKDAVCV